MTFCDIHRFALLTFVIFTTSALLQPRKTGNNEGGDKGSFLESAIFCSKAANCTCLFEKFRVTVKCTSAGDNFDEIAFELPHTATHL